MDVFASDVVDLLVGAAVFVVESGVGHGASGRVL
jgi:hypothetical protein